MYDPRYVLRSFDVLGADDKMAILRGLLDALILVDTLYLKAVPTTPALYDAGLRYEPEELGRDDWRDVPAVLDHRGGDCFPEGTLLLRGDFALVRIEEIRVGDWIWGRDAWSKVEKTWSKGTLAVDTILMSNGQAMQLTPDHKVYVLDESGVRRTHVSELSVGTRLLQPTRELSAEGQFAPVKRGLGPLTVRAIQRNVREAPCFDIQTSDHYVYLPEHDVTVSNCEDLACWRVSELRLRYGVQASPYVTSKLIQSPKYGAFTLYHIRVVYPAVVLPQLFTFQSAIPNWIEPSGSSIVEDPSLRLGMPA